jgi:hypothetical protein
MFCPYKNIFGAPNTGAHSYRIFNLAIVDIIMTIIGAYIISYFSKFSFYYTLAILFITGIILHRLFCVRTTIDKLLFPNVKDENG